MKNVRMTAFALSALVLLVAAGRAQADLVLLVGNAANNGTIVQFDAVTGAGEGTFVAGNGLALPVRNPTGPTNAFGLGVGPDGNVYVVDPGTDVRVYDGATGAFVRSNPTPGLGFSFDIQFTAAGNYFVAGFGTNTVRGFTAAGSPTGLDIPVSTPTGLALRGDELFVASNQTGSIFRFSATTGAPLGSFATTGAPGIFDLAFAPNGDLFASAGTSIFRFDGTTGAQVGSPLTNAALTGARGLGFGPDGNLYVVNDDPIDLPNNVVEPRNAILRFNPNTGDFLGTFATGNGMDEPTYLLFADLPAVPEPTSVALIAVGALGLVAVGRTRMRRRAV